jgi:small subunit ribosomal protein S16
MVRIRLRRVGLKKQASYRIVVADKESPRDGRYIEIIGFYNPRTEPPQMDVQEDRALYWLKNGAQPSEAVARILDKTGTTARLARLHKGESMETLVAEAAAATAAKPQSLKTRQEAPAAGTGTGGKKS